MKKIMISLIIFVFGLFGSYVNEIVCATDASQQQNQSSTNPSQSEINKYRSGPSRYQPSTGYHQSPTRPAPSPSTPLYPERRTGGFLSHLGAFGAGAFLGSMFHPFGGYYGGYGMNSFSLFGLIADIVLIFLVFFFIRRLFRRRY